MLCTQPWMLQQDELICRPVDRAFAIDITRETFASFGYVKPQLSSHMVCMFMYYDAVHAVNKCSQFIAIKAPSSVWLITPRSHDCLCRYDNCELRTVVMYDQGGSGGFDRTWWHPKGHHNQLQR